MLMKPTGCSSSMGTMSWALDRSGSPLRIWHELGYQTKYEFVRIWVGQYPLCGGGAVLTGAAGFGVVSLVAESWCNMRTTCAVVS